MALPSSQQPGALVAIGQYIFDKGDKILYVYGYDFVGVRKHFTSTSQFYVYAISDKSSILAGIPYAIDFKDQDTRSSGFQDAFVQYEYAFFASPSNKEFIDTASIVANVNLPTGSATKEPPTGFGSANYFLGMTYLRLYTDWLVFGSYGITKTTKHHGIKFGNEYFYQGGFGKNICYVASEWIFSWMIEFDGQFSEKDVFLQELIQDSGGNIIYATPSIWFSTQKLVFQFGVGVPVVQRWNGQQTKHKYLIAADFAWKF